MEITKYFSNNINEILRKLLKNEENQIEKLEEIRLRSRNPLILKYNSHEEVLSYIVTIEDLIETLTKICENSIYAYQNQIINGYITVKGGHRVGLTGNAVIEDEKIINIKNISSLNFRISRQIKGSANSVIKYIYNEKEKNIYNTLIVSAPGQGKTTLLRDLVRQFSNGTTLKNGIKIEGKSVGLIDERGEIASMYKGIAENDVGIRTDIFTNIPKSIGMKMLIRSMAPKIVAADEIGSFKDVEAIEETVCSGVKGIFTAHGKSLEDLMLNPALKELLRNHIFERIIILESNIYRGIEKGVIEKIYRLDKTKLEYLDSFLEE